MSGIFDILKVESKSDCAEAYKIALLEAITEACSTTADDQANDITDLRVDASYIYEEVSTIVHHLTVAFEEGISMRWLEGFFHDDGVISVTVHRLNDHNAVVIVIAYY